LNAATVDTITAAVGDLLTCAHEAQVFTDDEYPFQSIRKLKGLPWKAANVWKLLDAQLAKDDHAKRDLKGMRVVVVGAGPVGLRTALELRLAGATVRVLEKRNRFVRINRLHLWDWVKTDLVGWGAKVFSPPSSSFGADKDYIHIGISELQYLLLKNCLLLGVSVDLGTEYTGAKFTNRSWCVTTSPKVLEHGVNGIGADAIICCDGAASRVAHAFGCPCVAAGLGKDGKAIGVVANFVNARSKEERNLRQFSWARQFNAPLFNDIKKKYSADLENVVYYSSEATHYMIFTPTKQSLLDTGCVRQADAPTLLGADNVDMAQLTDLAKNIACHFGIPPNFTPSQSVSIFDFSETKRHERAIVLAEDPECSEEHPPLVVCFCGDALLEPFWPEGLGIVRGFLSALDCVSSLQVWAQTKDSEAVGRHSDACYKILKSVAGQTREMTLKPAAEWRLDPATRYKGFK